VLALVLLLALAGAGRAEPAVVGRPLLALADDTEVALLLRQASGGRQAILARRIRNPGPPIAAAEEGWVYGWTCAPPRCGREDLFIAWNAEGRQLVLMLVDDGVPTHTVPPRSAPWPRPMQAPLAAFRAALGR
jgi:hypothetical protein